MAGQGGPAQARGQLAQAAGQHGPDPLVEAALARRLGRWLGVTLFPLSLFDADASLHEEGRQDNEPGIIPPPHTHIPGEDARPPFLVDLSFY